MNPDCVNSIWIHVLVQASTDDPLLPRPSPVELMWRRVWLSSTPGRELGNTTVWKGTLSLAMNWYNWTCKLVGGTCHSSMHNFLCTVSNMDSVSYTKVQVAISEDWVNDTQRIISF